MGEGDQPAGVAAVGPDQGDAVVLGAQLFQGEANSLSWQLSAGY
ncbi:hypothetical protein ACFV0C_36295 [Streptomyces sp. NPDC059568]